MKKFVLVTLLVLMTLSCAFAATEQYAAFQYYIAKPSTAPSTSIDVFFTDSGYRKITTFEIDTRADLRQEQVILTISTNKKTNYNMTLTFFPMFCDDDPTHEYVGLYRVKVMDDGYEAVTASGENPLTVNNRSGIALVFAGPKATGNKVQSFLYPISFDFTDYIEDYPAGDYTGIIRVEAATV